MAQQCSDPVVAGEVLENEELDLTNNHLHSLEGIQLPSTLKVNV